MFVRIGQDSYIIDHMRVQVKREEGGTGSGEGNPDSLLVNGRGLLFQPQSLGTPSSMGPPSPSLPLGSWQVGVYRHFSTGCVGTQPSHCGCSNRKFCPGNLHTPRDG